MFSADTVENLTPMNCYNSLLLLQMRGFRRGSTRNFDMTFGEVAERSLVDELNLLEQSYIITGHPLSEVAAYFYQKCATLPDPEMRNLALFKIKAAVYAMELRRQV